MRKIIMTLGAFMFAAMVSAHNPQQWGSEFSDEYLQVASTPVVGNSSMMARIYQLNGKQTKQLCKLNKQTFEARAKLKTKYEEKCRKASSIEKKTKLENKMIARMSKLQDEYNDAMLGILNRHQYRKYCMDFQRRQARLFQTLARISEQQV